MKFYIIVAKSLNNGIGINNKIPWYIPEDLQFFKYTTLMTISPSNVNIVVMGRKTFESIKMRPLKGRINIVISKTLDKTKNKSVIIFDDFNSAIEFITSHYNQGVENVFFIGGNKIYEEALNFKNLQGVYITKIEKNVECDVFFPPFNIDNFNIIEEKKLKHNDIDYSRMLLISKNIEK